MRWNRFWYIQNIKLCNVKTFTRLLPKKSYKRRKNCYCATLLTMCGTKAISRTPVPVFGPNDRDDLCSLSKSWESPVAIAICFVLGLRSSRDGEPCRLWWNRRRLRALDMENKLRLRRRRYLSRGEHRSSKPMLLDIMSRGRVANE